MKQRFLSQADVYQKLTRYCAYQDRCTADIRLKMFRLGQMENQIEEALAFLKEEGFLDDERYAKAYVRGKFSSNKWGRIKIKEGLYSKKIAAETISIAMKELDEDSYIQQLVLIIESKYKKLEVKDAYIKNQKLALYAHSKGYELDLIWNILKKLNNGESREY